MARLEDSFGISLVSELKANITEYLKITDSEAVLMDYLLRDCRNSDVQIKLKTLSLLGVIMSKRKDLETFMTRMILVKGDEEIDLYKKYSSISDNLSTSSEILRLRIYNDDLEQQVSSCNSRGSWI